SYLVRRLEEGASADNFISAVVELEDETMFQREAGRFLASLEQLENEGDLVPEPRRKQNRQTEDFSQPSAKALANAADADPDLPANRDWGRQIIARMATSQLGQSVVDSHRIESKEQLGATITAAQQAGSTWQDLPLPTRSQVLIRV